MLNTVNNNIVDTTFETTTKQLYFLRTKRKMFSIFMQKKYIYIYKNSWWSVWYRYRLQLENAIEKSIHKNKHFVITVWSHVYLVCIVYKKFDFFFFFACVCVCVNIRKNCLLCAVNRQSCIYSFWAIWCVLFFFLCMWIWWQNW